MKRSIRCMAVLLAALLCATVMAALAEGHVTTTGSVNLRKGPGLDYKSICTIGAGVRLSYSRTSVDDRNVTWYRVTYDGKKGWVSSMYASEGGSTVESRVTTTSNAHLRAGAGTGYASRAVIDVGTTLTYDQTARDDAGVTWYRVSYRDKRGWVSSKVVRRGEGTVSGRVTLVGDAHLRSGAGLGYASRDVVPLGTVLTYDRTQRDDRGVTWYHVSYGGQTGWVSSAYASASGSTVDSRVTTTGSVNLRSGPGLDYASRMTIGEGVTLTYDRTQRDDRGVTWYHVSYSGRAGWVSSMYTRRGGASADRRVQLTGSANVRSGPGLDYGAIGTVDEGTTLTWLGSTRKDERGVQWYNVSYRGESGWVSSRYARLK